MNQPLTFRVATYNVHKCIGLDRRLSPSRIAQVLLDTGADIVALQEVVRTDDKRRGGDQFAAIAAETGFAHCCFGANRSHWGGAYGNAILSRWPILAWHNHDVSIEGREPRGMLQADIRIHGLELIHILNIHLGTGYVERRRQADRLLGEEALLTGKFKSPRILLGDFNEWTRGQATQRLRGQMQSAELTKGGSPSAAKKRSRLRSYPGIFPLLHLDHIYYDGHLKLREFRLHRSKLALLASDHLPLVACFEVS